MFGRFAFVEGQPLFGLDSDERELSFPACI